jgi:hypothetical protein
MERLFDIPQLTYRRSATGIVFHLIKWNAVIAAIYVFLSFIRPWNFGTIDPGFFGFINIVYFLLIFIEPVKLIIDSGRKEVRLYYFPGFLRRRKIIPLSDLEVTFNKEDLSSETADELRLVWEGKTAAEIDPHADGWGEAVVKEIFEKINAIKVVDPDLKMNTSIISRNS